MVGMSSKTKSILMCKPTFFEVAYEINEWMHVDDPVDVELAREQWKLLHDTYEDLGFDIKLVEPVRGLPDLVFTANGGLVIDGQVFLPRFKFPERQGETPVFEAWFRANGYKDIYMPEHDNEGEGDTLYNGEKIFAGYGFRSDLGSHPELEKFFGKEVVSLKLIDPRFYHLDTAMAPITPDTVMYFPGAFDEESQAKIEANFTNRIIASEEDAAGFGLNAVSDGKNVVVSAAANGLISELEKRDFNVVGRDMTEFRKAGGAVKCCTLELRT